MSSHISVFPLDYFNSWAQLKEKYEALLADKEKELNLVKTWKLCNCFTPIGFPIRFGFTACLEVI